MPADFFDHPECQESLIVIWTEIRAMKLLLVSAFLILYIKCNNTTNKKMMNYPLFQVKQTMK